MSKSLKILQPYFLALPQILIFLAFLVLPIAAIILVSFWQFTGFSMVPAFTFDNYAGIFDAVTLNTYLNTFKFVLLACFFCLVISYPVAYFLAFHIENSNFQIICFLICTVPFLTSNIIRTISWIPFLGREGLVNGALIGIGIIKQPLGQLLYSDFSVVLAMVHLYTLFMIAPIFNSMMRIDRALIAAAADAGASPFQIQKEIILPLSSSGIAIGSIFIVTLVMGEFATVRVMGGGQVASVGNLIKNQIDSLQYPLAAANAVILLIITLILVFSILRVVDIRKEL